MTNKTQCIGILGGAGPLAGSLLMTKVIQCCQIQYQCSQDDDFPKILLFSYPFSQMLQPNTSSQQEDKVHQQLQQALEFLYSSGCSVIAIACNTLHGFLTEAAAHNDRLVHLPELALRASIQKQCTRVLTLCTSTAVVHQVHQVPLVLPSASLQREVDALIQSLLCRSSCIQDRHRLETLITQLVDDDPEIGAVLLGCTELSVLNTEFPLELSGQIVIDPLELAAKELCKKYFEKGRET